jgi:hypothetical protein
LIAAGLVFFGPGAAVMALPKEMLMFLLTAGLVSLLAETWVTS